MVFKVTRTSDYYNEKEPPMEGAVRYNKLYTEYDYRTVSTLKEMKKRFFGKKWLSEGKHHREIVKGGKRMVVREVECSY